MNREEHNGDIWDEHMWEVHIERMERKSEELRKFIEASHDNLPRWLSLLDENDDKLDAVDAFIDEELMNEGFWFSDEPDDENGLDEEDEFGYGEFGDDDFYEDDFSDDYDEGEEWKRLREGFAFDDNGSIENLAIYVRSHKLAVHTLEWADELDEKYQDEQLSEFVSNILVISAKLAGGHSFGFETDFIGGNIACTKKALNAANNALTVLERKLKRKGYMSSQEYQYLHGQLFELRNDIGIYVQELRERFNLGLD